MSFLCGALLLHMTEEQCFISFDSLLNWDILYYCYKFEMAKVNGFFGVFSQLLKKHVQTLWKILKEHKIPVNLFLFEWIITLFSNVFPLDFTVKLWDQFFYYGQLQVIRCALAVCKLLEPPITEVDD